MVDDRGLASLVIAEAYHKWTPVKVCFARRLPRCVLTATMTRTILVIDSLTFSSNRNIVPAFDG